MNIWIMNHHARDTGRHPSFAKYLSLLGAEVTLFSASFLHNSFKETKQYDKNEYFVEEQTNNYKRIFIRTPKYYGNGFKRLINQIYFSYRSYKVGKKKIKQGLSPDVIIGSSVHLFTGLTAYFLSRKAKAKFVFEIRDIWPQTLIDIGALKEKSIVTKVFKKIERFLYKKSDLIISVLPHGYKYITQLNIPSEKIVYIPNGIDIKYFEKSLMESTDIDYFKNFLKERKNEYLAIFAGSHGKANGLDTIVEAAKILKDLEKEEIIKSHLILIGDGPEKSKLQKLAHKYELSNLTFFDKVEKNEIAHILKEIDLCLFHLNKTSVFKYGISSNKLFDYMLSKKPMVFAVDTSFDFAIEANNGISISPEEPYEMAKAIINLKENKKENHMLGKNGYDFVKENHDLEKLAKQLLEHLQQLSK